MRRGAETGGTGRRGAVWRAACVVLALASATATAAPAARPKPTSSSAAPSAPLAPLTEPARPSRSAGPHPVWLAGPDGPIMPPRGFAPMGTVFGPAGAIAGGGGAVCAVPTPPACARRPETYRTEATRLACEAQTSRHVQEVFAYRECLDGEATRAVRAVNEAIRLLKCRQPTLKGCV